MLDVDLFIRSACADQLEKKTVREILLIELHQRIGTALIAFDQCFPERTFFAAGNHNQAFVMFSQPVVVNLRFVVDMATQVGLRQQHGQILVAIIVSGQDQ